MNAATGVVILGAGPSGLAAGACLRSRGVPFVIFDRADTVGSAWRSHYDRLHLHTVKQFSSLPGMPWGAHVPTYPSRQDVVDYLDAYTLHHKLSPRLGETVTRVARDGGAWSVTHTSGVTTAHSVIVATGYNRVPHEPSWPGRETFTGEVIHSSKYRNGRAWKGRDALVIGAGNSGAEIALDLWESGARTSLCIRSPLHVVPRDVFGIPAQVNSLKVMSRLPPWLADRLSLLMLDRVVGDLSPWGIRRPAIGPVSQVLVEKQIPLIDVGTVALIKQGQVKVVPGVDRFNARSVTLDDGREFPVDVVVLATGYRTGLAELIDGVAPQLDARGYPRRFGGDALLEDLYCIGYRNPLTGALHDIAAEAERVASQIAGAR
ncbi:MAG: NAD(P)/FAD-dependent oxidoreductase [Polyangiales bacterium]